MPLDAAGRDAASAQAIAKALRLTLADKPVARQRYIPSVPAYEAYLKGRYHAAQMTPDGVARKDKSSVGIVWAKKKPEVEVKTRAIDQRAFVLFPGVLPDRITAAAGHRAVTRPLFAELELLDVIDSRVAAALRRAA